MALWACGKCGCTYAVGLIACPQCGSDEWTEDGVPATAVVHVQKDPALSALLLGSGGPFGKQVNELANAASPENPGMTTVTFYDGAEAGVAVGLTALLERARAAGDPSAAGVEDILHQIGAEPAGEPAAGEAGAEAAVTSAGAADPAAAGRKTSPAPAPAAVPPVTPPPPKKAASG